DPNVAFAAGDVCTFLPEAAFVVHPQVGKWLIALGLMVGDVVNPWAWRLASAVIGVAAVILVTRCARRLFGSTLIGLVAGLLMAVDGSAIAHSRTGLLDQFLMFFALAAFYCLLRDQQRFRWRLFASVTGSSGLGDPGPGNPEYLPSGRPGWPWRGRNLAERWPWMIRVYGWRWWRLAAGVLLGLACGVKWSGIYFLAGFGVLTVLWDLLARRQVAKFQATPQVETAAVETDSPAEIPIGHLEIPLESRNYPNTKNTNTQNAIAPSVPSVGRPSSYFRTWLGRDAIPAFLALVPVAVLTYVASWFSWFTTPGAWGRDWALTHPGQGVTWLPPLLRSFWRYHIQMWNFHTGLDTTHPYSSSPLTWLFQWRPTAFYWSASEGFPGHCFGRDCIAFITSLGNPLLWWLACVAIVLVLVLGIMRRDWFRLTAALSGIAFGWLPWLLYLDRTVFAFYAIAFTPWIVLTLCYGFTLLLEFRRRRDITNQAGFPIEDTEPLPTGVGAAINNWPQQALCLWQTATFPAKVVVASAVTIILIAAILYYPFATGLPVPRGYWHNLMWLRSWI
ncbi:MAG: phospholipid carrier-dependent glycosyltransferase, partial [Promicromonosporaceae bacterium]|nr:phospholipid carrier-dependent glycosyltransferase [Promicromonosporaceae bacterium]